MLTRVHHIGIAVHDLDSAIEHYRDTFEITEWERLDLPERHMQIALCHVGETLIELITPTSPEAAFAKFLNERGEGMHHIAYEVAALEPSLRTLEGRGIRLIDAHGRPGMQDTCVAFVHPKSMLGVLIELVEDGNHAAGKG